MEWMLVKTFVSLLGVLALMAGIVIVFKKYGYKGQVPGTSVVGVEVLGSRMLAPKRSVHVLKVLNRVIVVGVTEGGMTSLSEIDDDETLRVVEERIALRTQNPSPFSALMGKYMTAFVLGSSKRQAKPARMSAG